MDRDVRRPITWKASDIERTATMLSKWKSIPKCGIWGLGALVFSMWLPNPALPEELSMRPPHQQSQWDSNREMYKLLGTVKKTQKVDTREGEQEHLVVQLQTQDEEKMIIVDLGNVKQLQPVDIQVGNRIIAWGRFIDMGDERVFMAHRLQTTDGAITIERSASDP